MTADTNLNSEKISWAKKNYFKKEPLHIHVLYELDVLSVPNHQ